MTTTTFGRRRFRKADIEKYYDRRWYPSVNVKVYASRCDFEALLPIELGQVSKVGSRKFEPIMTDERFTLDWLEANLSDSAQQAWWDTACQDGWDLAKERANEIFDQRVEVYSAGRSGGHLIVDGLPDVEDWDGALVSKWGRFVREINAIKDDTTRRYLVSVYMNVFEPIIEEQAHYVVTWTIDEYAGSAREAAQQALSRILAADDPDESLARVFKVAEPGGKVTTIDLSPGAMGTDDDLSDDTEV